VHRAIGTKDAAQRPEADVRVGKVVKHAGADDLVKAPAKLADIFNREPTEIETSQAVFSLKLARVMQAGLADVDGGHMSIRFAQRMDGSLGSSAAGHQDLSVCPRLLQWPQQQGQRAASIRVAIKLAVPVEVAERRRIRVTLVKSAHRIGAIGR